MNKFTIYKQVERAVKKGIIVKPSFCQDCKQQVYLQAHHENYKNPLDVIWLCSRCHGKLGKKRHNENGELGPISQIDGNKLLTKRTEQKITRADVGHVMGVTYQRVEQLEKPGKHNMRPIILKAVAKLLNAKIEELI